MKIKEYVEICVSFAEDTKEWGNLNQYQFYVTIGNSWEETCDNATGGIDVSWAFHLSPEQIKEEAPQRFVDEIQQLIQLAIDDEWEPEQMEYIKKLID